MTNGISNRTFVPHVITLEETINAAVVLTMCHPKLCSRSIPGELRLLMGFWVLELQQPKVTPWHTRGVDRGSSAPSLQPWCCAACWCRGSRAPDVHARWSVWLAVLYMPLQQRDGLLSFYPHMVYIVLMAFITVSLRYSSMKTKGNECRMKFACYI